MTLIKNLPLAKELLPVDQLPATFFEFNNSTISILEKIHFKNLYVSKGRFNESGNYSLTLVLFNQLGLVIPGTDELKLILNPSIEQTTDSTEIKISLDNRSDI